MKSHSRARTSRQSPEQKEIVGRVMHEFKEGDLRGRGSRQGKNPKQAIAIALREVGASNQASPAENRRNLRKTRQQAKPGKAAEPRQRDDAKSKAGRARTRAELYAEAQRRDIPGRSKMSRAELESALR